MKKILTFFCPIFAMILGGALGIFRFKVFSANYDNYAGILLKTADGAVLGINIIVCLFGLSVFLIGKNLLKNKTICHNNSKINKLYVYIATIMLIYSSYMAISQQTTSFEIVFAVSAIVGAIALAAITFKENDAVKLLTLSNVISAAFVLLYLYKSNIKFPSVALFSFELLAILFVMMGYYYASAMFFKKVSSPLQFTVNCMALMFSVGSIMTDYLVNASYIYKPIFPRYMPIYFVASSIILLAFSNYKENRE